MKLLRLHLTNFRQHADTAVEFPPEGITGIIGANESGKSTILEGAAWAIYGARAIRGTKAGVRWHRAPGRRVAEATLTFEVGGTRYRVHRTESNARVWIDGQAAPIAEGTAAVDAYLPERIGMGLAEFSATYMTSQKDLQRLSAMGPTERQTFIRGVLGLDRIDAALDAVRKRKNDLAHQVDGAAAGLGEREPLEAELAQTQAEMTAAYERAADLRGDVASAERGYAKAAAAAAKLAENRRRYEAAATQLRNAERDAGTAARGIASAEEKVVAAKAAAQRVADHAPQLAKLPGLRAERDALLRAKATEEERAQLAEQTIPRLEAELEGLRREAAELDERIAAHDPADLSRVEERYRDVRGQLRALRSEREQRGAAAKARADQAEAERQKLAAQVERIVGLGDDSPCPTCTRPLGEHLGDVVGALQDAIDAAAARAKAAAREALTLTDASEDESKLEQELTQLEEQGARLREAQTRADEARKRRGQVRHLIEGKSDELVLRRRRLESLAAVEYSEEQLRSVEGVIATLEGLERDVVAPARVEAGRIQEHEAELEKWRSELERATGEADHARQEIARLDFDPEVDHPEEAEAERLRGRLEQLRADLARAEERLKACEERRDQAERRLSEYDARAGSLQDLREQLRIHTAAAERLNVFRVEQAGLIRPELEELVTGFVSILTDGRHDSVTVTEDFQVTLQEGGIDAEVVSGGAEDITALALRLAISQMIAERAGHPLSLLILDEPFGSLDQVRRGNVISLIRRLRGVFQQVMLISHVEETREAVDHAIELEYDEAAGRSRVVQAPAPPTPAAREEVAA